MTMTTCESCDGVTSDTRKHSPSRWTCIYFPRIEGFSPVAPKVWVDTDPHMLCRNINGGLCPMWRPRRDGPIKQESI